MTDAKQALEVVERLREGAGRVARHCMRQAEHGDPGLISIPRHERDIDAIMEQAASLLSSLAEENERLRGWLSVLEPHLDAVICYASDMDEHPPNRVVAEVRAYLSQSKGAEE